MNRKEVRDFVDSYLASLSNKPFPLNEFKVVCDESNNSPEDIDQSRLNATVSAPKGSWLYGQWMELVAGGFATLDEDGFIHLTDKYHEAERAMYEKAGR